MTNHKPRICFFSFAPSPGGVATYQANNIAYLTNLGEISLVDEFPEHTVERLHKEHSRQLTVLTLPIWSRQRAAQPILQSWFLEQSPHVIAISNPGLFVRYFGVLRQVRQMTGAKIVVTVHSGTLLTVTFRRIVLEILAGMLLPWAQDRIYVSDFTRAYWERRYPWLRRSSSRVVPNGVPIPQQINAPKNAAAPLQVSFVGRLVGEKDPELFCQTAQLAHQRSGNFRFHIYGDGPLSPALMSRYGEVVQWHGHSRCLKSVLDASDLLLMTSPVENCPFALLEAKAYAIPIVAAAIGGIPEIVRNGTDGILSTIRSASGLLAALEMARDQYSALSSGCLETRSMFQIERIGNETWARHLVTDA